MPGWSGWLPKTSRIICINWIRWTLMKPAPAILQFVIGLNCKKNRNMINGVWFVNKKNLFLRNVYIFLKCFNFDDISKKIDKFLVKFDIVKILTDFSFIVIKWRGNFIGVFPIDGSSFLFICKFLTSTLNLVTTVLNAALFMTKSKK